MPCSHLTSPCYPYGSVPALIPLWEESSGPSYYGLWRHWFLNRKPTFVRYCFETGLLEEIAQTQEQLLIYLAVESIVVEDAITPEIRDFANEVGLSDDQLSRLDSFTDKYGDDFSKLPCLEEFVEKTPLAFCESLHQYQGQFAVSKSHLSAPLEEGIVHANKEAIFEAALEADNHSKAWLELNQADWPIPRLSRCLSQLAQRGTNQLFQDYAAEWIEVHKALDWNT